MNRTTTNLLGILITILAGTYFFIFYCSSCRIDNTNKHTLLYPTNTNFTSHPFTFKHEKFSVVSNENFNFKINSPEILEPISYKLKSEIFKVSDYLKKHPHIQLEVTGLFTPKEEKIASDMGINRALNVKHYLSSKGVPKDQIIITANQDTTLIPKDTTIIGPIIYHLKESEDYSKNEAILTSIRENPCTIFFNSGETTSKLSLIQRQQLVKIATYLQQDSIAMVSVTGHTDNKGSDESNTDIGLKRAKFISSYLVANGINANHISTDSKGSQQPIASNTNEEGRAENRRVTITIIKEN